MNIVLDVLLKREPHFKASRAVWAMVETGSVDGLLSAHAVTTIHYLIRRHLGEVKTLRVLTELLEVFDVAPVDGAVLNRALIISASDFEDAVTAAAARHAKCDFIVSRDTTGFRGSSVPCLTPEATIALGLR